MDKAMATTNPLGAMARQNKARATEVMTKSEGSRSGQDNGRDRVPAGPQAAQGSTPGNQLAHAVSEIKAQHPKSGNRVMRGAK